jgi:hypothetical protein
MTEGPGIAATAYLGEQVPDFGNALGPPPLQQDAEIRRGGSYLGRLLASDQGKGSVVRPTP